MLVVSHSPLKPITLMYINNDLERIGIRSEEVHSIFDDETPWFIHYGSIIIALAFAMALIAIVCFSLYSE